MTRADTQPAAVLRGIGEIEVAPIPVRPVGAGEVRVAISHCGVCGTDLHMVMDGWGAPGTVGGHEYSGVIDEIGADVDGWQVGDRVVYVPGPGCGDCRWCREKRPSLCEQRGAAGSTGPPGGFSTSTVVEPRRLARIPDGLSTRDAALAEPLAVAMHGIGRATVEPGDRVLVCGAGPIGALVTAVLADRGVTDIVVSEPAAARRDLAAAVGASTTVEPADLEHPSIAHPGTIIDDPFDVVFECSGVRAAMEAGLGLLRRAGTLVLLGSGIDPPRFDANRILLNELVVTGGFEYDDHGIEHALDLLATGRLPTDQLIESVDVPLAELQRALEELRAGVLAGKVLIVPTTKEA